MFRIQPTEMGADGRVIAFGFDEHVMNMIIERIKELEEVKEAIKNIKNPDDLKIDVDFNPIYPKKDRNPNITISFSVKDSIPSQSDTDSVSSGGAPAPSSSPPASVDVVAPVSDVAPIKLFAEPFYKIYDNFDSSLMNLASFNQDSFKAYEYIEERSEKFELDVFLEKYRDWSYYDKCGYYIPEDNFIVNCCTKPYHPSFDEQIKEFYEDMTPSDTEENKNLREAYFSLYPTWDTMRYYFDNVEGEMLIEYEEMQVN